MNSRARCPKAALPLVVLSCVVVTLVALTAVRAVLFPRVDSPDRVDAIVVVAGAQDDRYVYSIGLAEKGVADHILISRPPGATGAYAAELKSYCDQNLITARGGRKIVVECFSPDVDTTEGETTAATRIARNRGYKSLLVVTYWGHVSRVRYYFKQCFAGHIHVTDTPRPVSKSRFDALLYETGGYAKAILNPAC